ncbi:CarD family transcriptional regulator [Miniphocaeibacter halophilus]|uniref:CarD family transcriptional regulator n=1 Tax=Miniphocaeibacter halophilus TaxID=2931922 RepID=A0AC61MPG0_9FIRM|nr:CarD family transcriptional regulator [Miniphocaeibacter halophilus]QQK07386.1 CarD family transcriptional regulator [Miniphocaeibacter halophilus]
MFDIGDKIVYPMHGAGVIIEKEKKDILGIEKEYFILKMPVGDMKISIPIDKINEVGIRNIVDNDVVEDIFEILSEDQGEIISNWNQRYKDNLEKLRTGDLYEISKVFRDLYILDSEKGLSMAEKKILNTSKKMLISEISVVEDELASEVEYKIISSIKL